MRKNGILIFSVILILILTIFFAFHVKKRLSGIEKIEKRLAENRSDKQKEKTQFKVDKLFLTKNQIPTFIETLYKLAEDNRLKNYDILSKSDRQSGANVQKSKVTGGLQGIEIYPLIISIEGDYRNIAEYVRELQNIDRLKKIRDITITPEKRHIKAEISIDIFISGGIDAS